MKRFIYLNTPKVMSYNSQAYDGYASKRQDSVDSMRKTHVSDPSATITYGYSLNIPPLEASLSNSESTILTEVDEQESSANSVEYVIHDNMLDDMLEDLRRRAALTGKPTVGKYYAGYDFMDIVDVRWAINAIEMFDKLQKTQNASSKSILPREINHIIDLVELCLPSSVIVNNSKYVSFLSREYLRESLASLSIHYGVKLAVLGFCSQVYTEKPRQGNNAAMGFKEILKTLPNVALSSLSSMDIAITTGTPIIEPIAIFAVEENDEFLQYV